MLVTIIAGDDAKALATNLKKSLLTTVKHVKTTSADCFVKSKATQNTKTVKVIILTTLAWQEIQRLTREQMKKLFADPMNTIVLTSCPEPVKADAARLLSEIADDKESVGFYEASGEEWFQAEARIKYRLTEPENGEVHIPSASKYIVKPDSVSTLTESQSEVLIILFGEGLYKHFTDVRKVKVQVTDELIEAKKIQPNIWSFSALGLTPGDHTIRVFADDVDIGPNALYVQDQRMVVKIALADLKRVDPKGFLADLLNVNIEDFDHDLEDIVSGSSCIFLIEKLLRYGDDNEFEYTNFLHFCAQNGLQACVNWCKTRHPNFKEICMVQNKYGKTPEQIAKETHQNQLLIQALNIKNSEDKELQFTTSPFKLENFHFRKSAGNASCPDMGKQTWYRDSGCSSQGSGGSLVPSPQRPYDLARDEQDLTRYEVRKSQRTYDTIEDDDEKVTSPYHRPWDTKTMLPNRRGQAVSAGALSRSLNEENKEKRYGITRANTVTGCSTDL